MRTIHFLREVATAQTIQQQKVDVIKAPHIAPHILLATRHIQVHMFAVKKTQPMEVAVIFLFMVVLALAVANTTRGEIQAPYTAQTQFLAVTKQTVVIRVDKCFRSQSHTNLL